jgi:hypothetical protein
MAEENKKKYLDYDGLKKVVEQTKTYTDDEVAKKAAVQFVIWEEND